MKRKWEKVVAKDLDKIDWKILNILQKNARTPVKDIAEQVFLSSPAVTIRIQRLENKGYIEGYHAQINMERVGMGIKAFIKLALNRKKRSQFLEYIEKYRNVLACYTITGNYAILLETVFESTQKLDAFIQRLQEFGDTQTDIVFLTSSEHRQVLFPTELNDDEKQTDTLKK